MTKGVIKTCKLVYDLENPNCPKWFEVVLKTGEVITVDYPEPLGIYFLPKVMESWIYDRVKEKILKDRTSKIREILK